jgi:hypothetical protein
VGESFVHELVDGLVSCKADDLTIDGGQIKTLSGGDHAVENGWRRQLNLRQFGTVVLVHSDESGAAFAPCSPLTHRLMLPSPRLNGIGTQDETDFGAQWLACMDLHIERSRQRRRRLRPFEEGRSRWLIVLRKTLSFSISSRFIPALADSVFRLVRQ